MTTVTVFNVGDTVEYIGVETRRLKGHTGVISHVSRTAVTVNWNESCPYKQYGVATYNIKLVELVDIPGDNDDDCI